MVNDSYALDWLEADYPRKLFSDRLLRGLYYRFLRRAERVTYPRMARLLTNSEHVAKQLIGKYGIESSRVRVTRIGLPEHPPVAGSPLEGSPSVLFVGGNFQRKGLPVLLEAANRIRSFRPGLRIHVVGADRNQPAVEARARALGVGECLTFHGWLPNERVLAMMAGADIFALPSWTEAFGLVYLEAMRAGTPVVATSVGGLQETMQDGEEALFVKPGDAQGLAAAIERIVESPDLAARLSRKGLAASKRFSVANMVAATEKILAEVLSDDGH
jgi:glycosyltransferase involved in cell wall biosynthesis